MRSHAEHGNDKEQAQVIFSVIARPRSLNTSQSHSPGNLVQRLKNIALIFGNRFYCIYTFIKFEYRNPKFETIRTGTIYLFRHCPAPISQHIAISLSGQSRGKPSSLFWIPAISKMTNDRKGMWLQSLAVVLLKSKNILRSLTK